jgi:hypothetical protein
VFHVHQLALDEASGFLYTVDWKTTHYGSGEFPTLNNGRLLRGNLKTFQWSAVGLHDQPIGLLLSGNLQTIYISYQQQHLDALKTADIAARFGDATSATAYPMPVAPPLVTSYDAPLFFMSWEDEAQTKILVTERIPANHLWEVNTTMNATALGLAPGVNETVLPPNPSGIIVFGKHLYVCSNNVITQFDLSGQLLPPQPNVHILAPGNNVTIQYGQGGLRAFVDLSARGSPGMLTFTWSDTSTGSLGTGKEILHAPVTWPSVGQAPVPDIITVQATDIYGHSASAQVTIYLQTV